VAFYTCVPPTLTPSSGPEAQGYASTRAPSLKLLEALPLLWQELSLFWLSSSVQHTVRHVIIVEDPYCTDFRMCHYFLDTSQFAFKYYVFHR